VSNEDKMVIDGVVTEALRGGQFKVEIPFGEKTVLVQAYISGKIRKHDIKIVPGDKVTVEFSTFDLSKGRIVFRNR